MTNYTEQYDIDLVYLWVDGSDEEWLNKKKRFLGEDVNHNTEATSKARNADNNELIYSLRSVEKMLLGFVKYLLLLMDKNQSG